MSQHGKWEMCPRCGSNRVTSGSGCFLALVGLGSISFGVWAFLIPVIGWLIGIILIVIGLGILIISPAAKGNLNCQDCQHNWKYPHQEQPGQQPPLS